jgi:hypothetical protein
MVKRIIQGREIPAENNDLAREVYSEIELGNDNVIGSSLFFMAQ